MNTPHLQKSLMGLGAMFIVGASVHAAVLTGTGAPNPADSGLVLWLDSSDASTLWQDTAGTVAAAAGQPIARWDDKSLSGIVVNQTNPANTPSYTTGTGSLGGVNTVSFTGGAGGDALTSTTGNSTGVSGGGPLTMVTIWQTSGYTSQNYQHTIHIGDTVGSQAYGHSVSRGTNGGSPIGNHYWGSGFDTTATADLSGHMALSTYNGTTDNWFVDGAAVGSNNVTVNIATNQLQIGSRLNPFTEGFTGELAEVIMFSSELSESERNLLGGYVQNKYGLSIANAVPEPSSSLLALLGMAGLLKVRRRK